MLSLPKSTRAVHGFFERASPSWPGRARCFQIKVLVLLVLLWPREELLNRHLLNLVWIPSRWSRSLSPPERRSPTRSCKPGRSCPWSPRSPSSGLLEARPALGCERNRVTVILLFTWDVQVVTLAAGLKLAQVAGDHIGDGRRRSTRLRSRDKIGLERQPAHRDHFQLAVTCVARADAVVLRAVLETRDQALDQGVAALAGNGGEAHGQQQKSPWGKHCG